MFLKNEKMSSKALIIMFDVVVNDDNFVITSNFD